MIRGCTFSPVDRGKVDANILNDRVNVNNVLPDGLGPCSTIDAEEPLGSERTFSTAERSSTVLSAQRIAGVSNPARG